VKERPILFKGDMVRAILEGRKTQTRRVVKPQPHDTYEIECGIYHPTVIDRHGEEDAGSPIFGAYSLDGEWGCKCLYGQPGDRLWVRETWFNDSAWGEPDLYYRANGEFRQQFAIAEHRYSDLKWKPSIHMPRWACRIELEIVSVRVERLNDISVTDAINEGIEFSLVDEESDAVERFCDLWESINGAGSWQQNPWVWVVEFKRAQP